MKCFLLSSDLMFSSQVSGAARVAGYDVAAIRSADQIEAPAVGCVVVDLTMNGIDLVQLVSRSKECGLKVIAVGPHVHEQKLESARDAGCDFVLTKGQASRELASFLSQLQETTE